MIKNRWLYFVIAALSFMAVVNSILITSALKSPSPRIEQRPYEHGMDFEKDISAMTLAKDLKIDFALKNSGNDRSDFSLEIDTSLFENLVMYRIKCIRPSMGTLDREFLYEKDLKKNIFISPALLTGLWLIEFQGTLKDGREILIKKSIML
jgi:hypothetical protein